MGRLDEKTAEKTAEMTPKKDAESIAFDKLMSKGYKEFPADWKRSDDIFDHETLISNGITADLEKEEAEEAAAEAEAEAKWKAAEEKR